MLAIRLVRLIENHSEQLSRDLSEKVWNSPRCSDLHKVPATELEARTREIYRNLSDWLMDKTEAEVERRSDRAGRGARPAGRGLQPLRLGHHRHQGAPSRLRPARRSVR